MDSRELIQSLPSLKQEVFNWVNSTLPRLASEKGRIEGFLFKDERERAFQQDLLREYGARISMTRELDEITRNWELEQAKRRYEHMALMNGLRLESIANLEGFLSKLDV